MDTGEYETNALVINNISLVSFAYYEPVPATSTLLATTFALEFESSLRKEGFLTYVDSVRRRLWCFRLSQKSRFREDEPQGEGLAVPKTITRGHHTICLVEEGAFEPAALVKSRSHNGNAANTPSSSSSSASGALDTGHRSAQSATLPSFPHFVEQDVKTAVAPADAKPASTTTTREAHENLVLATISTITASFCTSTSAIPLNLRTLLLARTCSAEHGALPAILASLRVYLTTTGCLVVTLCHSLAENLVHLSETLARQLPPWGATVLAAPLGVFATCQPAAIGETAATTEGNVGQSPGTQILRLHSDPEQSPSRNVCSKVLQSRNVALGLESRQKWISLQRMRRKPSEQHVDGKSTPIVGAAPTISWPSSLCFCKAFSSLSISSGTGEQRLRELQQCFDPLNLARTWFLGTKERDEALDKKKRERDTAPSRENLQSDDPGQQANGLSPLALRGSNQNGVAGGGMYPTPPDGIQGLVGVTPSMDGAVPSPGAIAVTAVVTDVDMTPAAHPGPFSEHWDASDIKRDRRSSSIEPENLFGELGPDMFGDNDITEADFSFFDEEPGGLDLGSLDLPHVAITSTDSTHESERIAQPTLRTKLSTADLQKPVPPKSPIFTKPDLRHARSSLGDEPRRRLGPDQNRTGTFKRPASPFNPDTVYKRVRASLENQKAVQQNSLIYGPQHGSIFDKVDFGPGLSKVNSKYEGSGRYGYSHDASKTSKSSISEGPPTTDYLRRYSKSHKNPKELPTMVGQFFLRDSGLQTTTSNQASPENIEDCHSDTDETSLTSDQDISSCESDEAISPFKPTSMRKRRVDDDGESLATSFRDLEAMDTSSPYLPIELPGTSKFEVELPLTRYFADPEPPWIQYSLPDDQLIMVAQILTDQLASSTLPINAFTQASLHTRADQRRTLSIVARNSMQELRSIVPQWFGSVEQCRLRPFIEVQDVPLLGQPTRIQPRPPGADQMRPSNLFQIPPPHFEMRRYEAKLSVLPSAVSFWESLGLSPSLGSKDISAVCLYPDYRGLHDDTLVFTDRLRSIYESLKLGSFGRLPSTPGTENGLFAFEVEHDSAASGKSSFLGLSLQTCASKICKALASTPSEHTNLVVFFVYCPSVPSSIVECCTAFNEIFEGYKRLLLSKGLPVVNDLALQLIPQDFVASSSSVAMPSPMEFTRLALEVYDRCTQFGVSVPSPAILLEQPPPRMIDFKLTANPSTSLLHENMCLHIAYAQSVDERWITAAWTDNRGSQQMTASYCLGRKGKTIVTPIGDVAHEIWLTTRDLIAGCKIHWRVIIAKCGAMEPHEIEIWSSLAQTETKANITLTLIGVDTDPSMQLLPQPVRIPSSTLNTLYTTPVSTPQASTVSPEQSGNPSTPARDNAGIGGDNNAPDSDADATLADLSDQTWGAVLSHRLSSSTSTTDLNHLALISGYLVKRGGPRADDPPVVLEVNIVHSEGNPRAYETLLREVLTYYRGLGTLARARGMVDKETDIRPWHVAAAEKGVRALYMLM